ncbi:FAD-dependent oxidoreductase [Streptomyces sp. UP1A-1]|nr:FAD-dependent oxidoreductase [Streptomyces sp. UP1A-1]
MSMARGHGRGLPMHRHLSRRHALRVAPALKKDALVGALQYYDAQMDDARFVTTLVRTAASYGAQVANRARVTSFLREGERVVGARVQDVEAGGEYEIRAKQVVNATGVWTDDTQSMVGERGQFHVRASKGIHLVVPKDRIHSTTGLILRTEKSVLFVIPWGSALDHRHHRHRLGPGQGPPRRLQRGHRLPPGARQLRAPRTAHARRRRGRLRRAAPAAGRASPTPPASSRASTPSRTRCPAWWSSRAASTRRTG